MNQNQLPSPDLFFEAATAYQKSAALRAGIDLDFFTHLAERPMTAGELASRCDAAERGVRILCDYLTIHGFLTKEAGNYRATPDSAVFLNRKSGAFAGGAAEFLLGEELTSAFKLLTESVRKGGTAKSKEGSIAPEHPMWITFAQTMGGLMISAAQGLGDLLAGAGEPARKILDIAASHGMWGLGVARKFPEASVFALDWAPVLKVAVENARAAGVSDRFHLIEGDAFEVALDSDYDIILIPNFLHHFSKADCLRFMRKMHGALRPGGRVAIVEFVPDPDRITPPPAAGFSLVMLATTPEGDAYTFEEYAAMLRDAGFNQPAMHALPASANQAIIAAR